MNETLTNEDFHVIERIAIRVGLSWERATTAGHILCSDTGNTGSDNHKGLFGRVRTLGLCGFWPDLFNQ